MTPEALASLHARAFDRLRPWSAREFADLLKNPHVFLCPSPPQAFALGRAVLDEAELLTIATDPAARRSGHGAICLQAFETEALHRGARQCFLEVDGENQAAIGLYNAAGYAPMARRKAYYALSDGTQADAILMAKALSR